MNQIKNFRHIMDIWFYKRIYNIINQEAIVWTVSYMFFAVIIHSRKMKRLVLVGAKFYSFYLLSRHAYIIQYIHVQYIHSIDVLWKKQDVTNSPWEVKMIRNWETLHCNAMNVKSTKRSSVSCSSFNGIVCISIMWTICWHCVNMCHCGWFNKKLNVQ